MMDSWKGLECRERLDHWIQLSARDQRGEVSGGGADGEDTRQRLVLLDGEGPKRMG